MSVNVGATVSNAVTLTPSPETMTLTPVSAGVTGVTNAAVDVTASIDSMALSSLSATIGSNVIVQPGFGSMALTAQNSVVDYTPVQGDVNVDVGNQTMTMTEQNPFITSYTGWSWNIPSLQDETDFYTNVMGWTIPADAETFAAGSPGGYTWNASGGLGTDIHSNTEGDELWTWDQNLKRHGIVSVGSGSTTQDWYDDMLADSKVNLLSALANDDPNDPGTGYGYDHIYGQGLATIYNDTSDPTILTVLDGLKSNIQSVPEYQTLAGGGDMDVATFEGRAVGRWTIVAAYAVQATGDTEWVTIRDNLQRALETSSDWEEGGVIKNGGGLFFASRSQSSFVPGTGGTASYDAGRRFHSAFELALLVEGMWRCFVQTGSVILRERLIKIARYIEWYAHDAAWIYPNVGGRFGHEGNGDYWHISPGDGTATNAAKDCSYDMSLVNAMVIGYKLTGETNMLTFAQTLFSRGNRYDPGGSYDLWAASLNHVHKYLDTQCNNSRERFQWNKGTLQYSYQVLENGGAPSKVNDGGTIQTLADSLSSGTWGQLSLDDANFKSLTLNTAGTERSALEFAQQMSWNSAAKELHFRGGGASSGSNSAQRHVRYSETTGLWDAVTPWMTSQAWVHQWGHQAFDPRTGDLYFKQGPAGGTVVKWPYERYPATVTQWDSWDTAVGDTSAQAQCMEFFPDLNDGYGALCVFDLRTTKQLYVSDGTLLSYSTTPLTIGVTQDMYDYTSIYCPAQKALLFGGGKYFDGGGVQTFGFGRIDSTLTDTQLNTLPFAAGTGGNNAVFAAFPNGRIFAVDPGNSLLREYDYAADSFSTLGSLPFTAYWRAVTAIPEYGVIYVCSQLTSAASSTIEHWIYKI